MIRAGSGRWIAGFSARASFMLYIVTHLGLFPGWLQFPLSIKL
jgi:hypothetical protein